jgi:uncharacterized protein YndB with AHSA1/START domain
MKELIVRNSIIINADAAKVWNVLTSPDQTKKYMFGCETVSDWKQGSLYFGKACMKEKKWFL